MTDFTLEQFDDDLIQPTRARSGAMSKAAYLLAYYLPAIGGVLGIGAAVVLLQSRRTQDLGILALAAGVLALLGSVVTLAVFVHRIWSAVPRQHARTTPGAAVGMMFVPVFNLYWMFQVLPGFATDFNKAAAARGIGHRVGAGPFLTYAVFVLCAMIPLVGVVAALANLIVVGFVISAGCEAVNQLAEAVAGEPRAASPVRPVSEAAPATPSGDGTALGVFALLIVVQMFLFANAGRLADVVDFRLVLGVLTLVFSPTILVMGMYVRRPGLRATVIVTGALVLLWRLADAWSYFNGAF